jgi:hypothetical protein
MDKASGSVMDPGAAPGRHVGSRLGAWFLAPLVVCGFAILGAYHLDAWFGTMFDPLSPYDDSRLLLSGALLGAALGTWSVMRQPCATVFALVVGLLSPVWDVPAFPLLCAGLIIAPLLPRRAKPARHRL